MNQIRSIQFNINKMKRVYLFLVMMASMLFITSCQQTLENPSFADDEVTFTVTLPSSLQTKAVSDGLSATELTYAVYNVPAAGETATEYTQLRGTATFPAGSLTTTITVKFVKGNHYQMVFWAQSPQAADNGVYNISDLRAVKVNYANAKSNDEYRDAFYAYVKPFQVTQSFTQEVTLHRPFAQINFGTSDLAYAASAGFDLASTQSKVLIASQVATTLNTFDGTVADPVEQVVFDFANIPAEKILNLERTGDLEIDGVTYDYIATNYILVNDEATGADKDLLNSLTLTFKTVEGESSLSAVNVPVQRNYRTNLLGELLTTDGDFIVTIDPIYEEPDYFVDVWNGTSIEEPALTQDGYIVTSPEELAWFQENPIDNNIFIAADLDLNGYEFKSLQYFNGEKPIRVEGLPVSKSETRNPVIRNFKGQNGLFASATADFKNIDFENVTIAAETSFVGVVCGNLYGDVENVNVRNSSIVANEEKTIIRVGGLVGIHNAGDATACTIDNVNISGVYHNAGGISGTVNETSGRSYTNCHAYNSNISIRCTDAPGVQMVGAISGNANGVQLILKGCSFDEATVPQVLVGAGNWSDADAPVFGVSPLSIVLEDVLETEVQINVTGNVVWSAVCEELFEGEISGEGEKVITLTIPENTLSEGVEYEVVFSTEANVETKEYSVVISQPAAGPVITNIADVELNETYTVKGIVSATNVRGFILSDATGSILYYNASYDGRYQIGQELTITGKIGVYNKGFQLDNTAEIIEGEVVGMTYPTPVVADAAFIDAFVAETANRTAEYVEVTGKLVIDGGYYNLVVDGTSNQGSFYFLNSELKNQIAEANGAKVKVLGYAITVSGTIYMNLVAVSIEILEMPEPEEPENPENPEQPLTGFSSNVDITSTDAGGSKYYTEKATVNGEKEINVLKLGTSSAIGKYTTKALPLTGDMTLSMYAVGWNGRSSKLTVTVNNGGTINGASSVTIQPKANTGAANNTPYTLTVTDSDYYTFDLVGVTESTTLTFSTVSGATRVLVFGVNVTAVEDEGFVEDPKYADFTVAASVSFSQYSDVLKSYIFSVNGNQHLLELGCPSTDGPAPEGDYTFNGGSYNIESSSAWYQGWMPKNYKSGSVHIEEAGDGNWFIAADLVDYDGNVHQYKYLGAI